MNGWPSLFALLYIITVAIYRTRSMGKQAEGSCGAGGDGSGDHRLKDERGIGGKVDFE